MTPAKKNLLVTLADGKYINQAKQFFASAFFNSGWQGDYMLLTHDISEEDKNWFERKGIIVYDPPLLASVILTPSGHIPLTLSKLYLFTEAFKEKWGTIIFYDCDVIIRASLDGLLDYSGLSAPSGDHFRLENEYYLEKMSTELRRRIDIRKQSFCAGSFYFKTNIIEENTFKNLLNLFNNNKEIFKHGDEALFNLYFYDKWNKVPIVYNDPVNLLKIKYDINEKRDKSIAIHFIHFPKPWEKSSPYYLEWHNNLERAEDINLANRLEAKRVINKSEIRQYEIYIFLKKLEAGINKIIPIKEKTLIVNRNIGKLGLKIKKISPRLYNIIRLKR